MLGEDPDTFFEYFDKHAAERAAQWIKELPKEIEFPRVFTLYFDSIDHACHFRGLQHSSGVPKVTRDAQLEYLGKIDSLLYNIIKEYKSKFNEEFDNTVFIITSDHSHNTVNPFRIVSTNQVQGAILDGLWGKFSFGGIFEFGGVFNAFMELKLFEFAPNGTIMQIYFEQEFLKNFLIKPHPYAGEDYGSYESLRKSILLHYYPEEGEYPFNNDGYVKNVGYVTVIVKDILQRAIRGLCYNTIFTVIAKLYKGEAYR